MNPEINWYEMKVGELKSYNLYGLDYSILRAPGGWLVAIVANVYNSVQQPTGSTNAVYYSSTTNHEMSVSSIFIPYGKQARKDRMENLIK